MPKGIGYSTARLRKVVKAQKSQPGGNGPKVKLVDPLIKNPSAMKSLAAKLYEG